MKVILTQNVQKLGKKFDVKEVSSGYANNFLIKNKLAIIADKKNLEWLLKQSQEIEKQRVGELREKNEALEKLKETALEIKVKTGKKGEFFEKITPQKIAEKLNGIGFHIEKEKIVLEKEINKVGEYEAKIIAENARTQKIKIIVSEK